METKKWIRSEKNHPLEGISRGLENMTYKSDYSALSFLAISSSIAAATLLPSNRI
jgi:hypothetical protein